MTEQNTLKEDDQQQSLPHPTLRSLDRLVGMWRVSGPSLDGQVTYSWMEGGFFLLQHIDLDQGEQKTGGIEIIGYDEKSNSLKSHYFGSRGEILEYEYEVDENTFTIWFGSAGSPAFYKGEWSTDGNTNIGAWQWPGGGYESTMTRVSAS